jgi:hypothetical protein
LQHASPPPAAPQRAVESRQNSRADPKIPHIHQGALEPFKAGKPPAPSASEEAMLAAGKTVTKSVKLPGQGGRAMAIFDVPAPPEVVWDCINDVASYPKMVSGVAEVSVYDGPRTSGGVTRTRARWTLSFLGYKVAYYNEMVYEPKVRAIATTAAAATAACCAPPAAPPPPPRGAT